MSRKLKVRTGVQHVTQQSGSPATINLHVQVDDADGKVVATFKLTADQMAVLLAGGSVDVESAV